MSGADGDLAQLVLERPVDPRARGEKVSDSETRSPFDGCTPARAGPPRPPDFRAGPRPVHPRDAAGSVVPAVSCPGGHVQPLHAQLVDECVPPVVPASMSSMQTRAGALCCSSAVIAVTTRSVPVPAAAIATCAPFAVIFMPLRAPQSCAIASRILLVPVPAAGPQPGLDYLFVPRVECHPGEHAVEVRAVVAERVGLGGEGAHPLGDRAYRRGPAHCFPRRTMRPSFRPCPRRCYSPRGFASPTPGAATCRAGGGRYAASALCALSQPARPSTACHARRVFSPPGGSVHSGGATRFRHC